MGTFKIQIIETIIVLALYIISILITKKVFNSALKKTHLERTRRKMVVKSVLLLNSIIAIIFISAIWGMEQHEIILYTTTILTVLGIAFFSDWSMLSNITSSIILFFSHPLKIGDHVKVLDADYPAEGEVTELNYFFIHLKTANNEIITIPNSKLFQKSISIIGKKDKTDTVG